MFGTRQLSCNPVVGGWFLVCRRRLHRVASLGNVVSARLGTCEVNDVGFRSVLHGSTSCRACHPRSLYTANCLCWKQLRRSSSPFFVDVSVFAVPRRERRCHLLCGGGGLERAWVNAFKAFFLLQEVERSLDLECPWSSLVDLLRLKGAAYCLTCCSCVWERE